MTIAGNLFLIPIYFNCLSKEEVGIWFLLSNSQGFLEVLGLGIAPTLSRKIALAKGKNGSNLDTSFSETSATEIGNLVMTGRIMLLVVALTSLFVSIAAGNFFINQLDFKEVSFSEVKLCWIILSIGFSSSVWLNYQYSLLSGLGYVGITGMLDSCLNILMIVANILILLSGGGLIELAIVSMLVRMSQRFLVSVYIKLKKPYILKFKGRWNFSLAKSLSKMSFFCWMTFLGKLLLVRTDQYFIASISSVENVAVYQATYQLVSNLRVFASSMIQHSSPFLSQLWQAGEYKKMHLIILRGSLLSLLSFVCGASFLLISGEDLISLWLGAGNFIGYNVLITICLLFLLDVQSGSIIFSARAIGREDFATASLLAGILNIALSYLLVKQLGIWGVPLATVLAVMFTTTWYSFYKGLSSLKISQFTYFKNVTSKGLAVFSLCILIEFCIQKLLETRTDYQIVPVIANASASLFVLASSIWLIVLSKGERIMFKSKVIGLLT
jgi:O-antigen/teichoic acid export membrane protein